MAEERKMLSASMDDICREPWNYAVEPFRVVGNLYFVGNGLHERYYYCINIAYISVIL